jgi:iron complex outermembrane receptor protein/vitamin B12 transporter
MHLKNSTGIRPLLLSFRSAAKEPASALPSATSAQPPRPLRSSFAVALTFACATAAHAQALQGRVLDPLGSPVPNATVELRNTPTQVTSAPDGTYTLPVTCPCKLRITAPTFAVTDIALPATAHADLTLQTPTRTDQITVTSGTPTPLARSGAPITVLDQATDYPLALNIEQPLRQVPGLQLTTVGQPGGVTSLFMRGGNSDFTKVLLDGVPVNDIGYLADLSTLAATDISSIEILRQPSSVLYGSDVLAGVVSLNTVRGATPLPLLTYAVDGGNLGSLRQQVSVAGGRSRADYATGFTAFQTANNQPNDQFHNSTIFGNFGVSPDQHSDLRFIARRIQTNTGNPNALALYGVPDLINQRYTETFIALTGEVQPTPRWHNLARYGDQMLDYARNQYGTNGTYSSAAFGYLGTPVTIVGANGYTVAGQAIIDYSKTSTSTSTTRRVFAYGQSDYRVSHLLTALGGFEFDSERGASTYSTAARRNYSGTLQAAGDVRNRLFYVLGSGIESNDVYGKALTPRASLAYYALRPNASRFFSGTKLHASFGKGIEEPSVGEQVSSLYGTLSTLTGGPTLISQYGITPLGGQYSRTYDAGLEQQFGDGRARINVSFFHNQFTNVIEYIPTSGLKLLGVPASVYTAPGVYGAYVNSLAYRALGGELESEFRISRSLFVRAGYTYLDARVQRSFSSDALHPTFNTQSNFASIPIGVYSPLVGARPFRRAPHTGYFALEYTRTRLNAQLTGTLVGRRDDSTFLGYSDQNGGNSLLLPNRNLDGAYQRLALSADYRITSRISTNASLDNLLNQNYQEAFGYPALPITIRGGLKFTFGGESFHLH